MDHQEVEMESISVRIVSQETVEEKFSKFASNPNLGQKWVIAVNSSQSVSYIIKNYLIILELLSSERNAQQYNSGNN